MTVQVEIKFTGTNFAEVVAAISNAGDFYRGQAGQQVLTGSASEDKTAIDAAVGSVTGATETTRKRRTKAEIEADNARAAEAAAAATGGAGNAQQTGAAQGAATQSSGSDASASTSQGSATQQATGARDAETVKNAVRKLATDYIEIHGEAGSIKVNAAIAKQGDKLSALSLEKLLLVEEDLKALSKPAAVASVLD